MKSVRDEVQRVSVPHLDVRPEVRTVSADFSSEEYRFVDRGTLDGDEGDREASTWR
jgi:hypothetical protein